MATYEGQATVTITCGTAGAQIVYCTDGSTNYDTPYDNPFTLYKNAEIRAIANKTGLLQSDVASESVLIKLPAGNYLDLKNPSIDSAFVEWNTSYTENILAGSNSKYGPVTMRYTTDGSDPTSSSPVLGDGGLDINQNCTLKYRLFADGNEPSDVMSVNITGLKVKTPIITVS